MKQRREYLQLLDKAISASEAAVDAYNRVHNPYRNEATLILATNGWELLAKAVLIKRKISIAKDRQGHTISAEVAVFKVRKTGTISEPQEDCIQQVISLRHAATHHILPPVPDEVMQHLLYFTCKSFKDVVSSEFPAHAKKLEKNYLSLSFADLTTYADKVQKMVSKVKRSEPDKRLVWLLDRGIQFDGGEYMTQKEFTDQFRRNKRIMPHLGISDFIKGSDMVRLIPLQAPKNYTADITLRKGKSNDPSLPVSVKKTNVEEDYAYLTRELGEKLGKTQNFAAALVACLKLKGDQKYHQRVRVSKVSVVERYSEAAFAKMKKFLSDNPDYNPYKNRPKT